MVDSQGNYGVSNLEYDLVTTLSNLLEGQEVLTKYAQDAEKQGDEECAQIFRTIQANNRQAAIQIRQALGKHMGGGQ